MLPKKKRCLGFDFKFKKFSIKQAIFIKDIFPSSVKAPKQKKFKVFFAVFLGFSLVSKTIYILTIEVKKNNVKHKNFNFFLFGRF